MKRSTQLTLLAIGAAVASGQQSFPMEARKAFIIAALAFALSAVGYLFTEKD